MTTKEKTRTNRTTKPKAGAVRIASPKELQAQAVAALGTAPKLATEKDGRLYAITMLRKTTRELSMMEAAPGSFSPYSGRSEETEVTGAIVGIWRKGPQYDGYKRAFDDLYAHATPAAINGFFAVVTDFFGSAIVGGGVLDVDQLPASERRGDFEPWGTVNYRDPKKAALALAKGKTYYRYRPMTQAEKRSEAKRRKVVAERKALEVRKANLQAQISSAAHALAKIAGVR